MPYDLKPTAASNLDGTLGDRFPLRTPLVEDERVATGSPTRRKR